MQYKRIRLSRRFEEDIWGDILSKGKSNKVMFFLQNLMKEKKEKKKKFVYRIDIINPKRKKGRVSAFAKLLRDRRKIMAFYGFVKKYEIKNIFKLALSLKGNFTDNVISILESKLCTVVYRMNFVNSIFEAKQIIREGLVLVNKEVITLKNYTVKEGDIIEILKPKKEILYNKFLNRLTNTYIFTSLPKYLEVNYRIMCGIFLYKPTLNEICFPFEFSKDIFNRLLKAKY